MPLAFTQIDAFADGPFTGNPAAVFVLSGFPEDDFMQAIAREMNLSETAFLTREAEAAYRLRWFTPNTEVDLCGHATLASAHALFESGQIAGSEATFETRSGTLHVQRNEDGSMTMDFPVEEPVERPLPLDLETLLGAPIAWYGENRMDAFVRLSDAGWVRSLDPDLNALARLPVRGLIVTAAEDQPGHHDFISRFFAPQSGVPEDPVTGSAHCALAPYWHGQLGDGPLVGYQASARGGRVRVHQRDDRVMLTGTAVTVVRGELLVDSL